MRRTIVLSLISLVSCCGNSAATQAADIIFAHGANPGNPRYVAAEKWAEMFNACTRNAHEVSVSPSAILGDDEEMLDKIAEGIIHISANSQGAVSQVVPEIGLLGLPFLFTDLLTARKVLEGDIGTLLDTRANSVGLKIIGYWDNGIRNVTHVSKHVTHPQDLQGMKIRIPPDPVTQDIFQTIGADPEPLAWSRLPKALQSRQFDGQENPLSNIYSAGLHKITPYITMTGHKYESTPVITSLAWWNSLEDKTRACVSKATSDAGRVQRQMSLQSDEILKPKMEAEGARFAEADKQAYQAAVISVYDKYAKRYPDLIAELKSVAGF